MAELEAQAAAEDRLLFQLQRDREGGPGSLVRPGPRSPASRSSPFTGSWPRMVWGRGG